jgi:hypothetical protein
MSMTLNSGLPCTDESMCSIHLLGRLSMVKASLHVANRLDPTTDPAPNRDAFVTATALLTRPRDNPFTSFSLAGIGRLVLHVDEPQERFVAESLYRRQARNTALHCIAYYSTRASRGPF